MRIAVLGATGAVGRTMLAVLDERGFPADEVVLLASPRSSGTSVVWRGREWPVTTPGVGAFRGCTLALFSAGAARSREWADRAAAEGAVVIDNSSAWRQHPEVPLVVPEVNAHCIAERPRGIIANPNCSTIQLVVALEAIRRLAGLRRVVATTLQSVSGAGNRGLVALRSESSGEPAPDSPFPAPILGNVIPAIGPRGPSGWNEEEEKVRNESRKILGLPALAISATCVRVPVEVGHSIAATVETERPLPLDELRAALAVTPGIELADDHHDPLPREIAGSDLVRVGRLRADPDVPGTIHLWIVADNLRKGAATNAIQIAERIAHG